MAASNKESVSARLPEENHFRRAAILEAVSYVADSFLRSRFWKECIGEALKRLGQAADASSAYVFENHTGPDGTPLASLRYYWLRPNIEFKKGRAAFENLSLKDSGLGAMVERLESDRPVHGSIDQFPEPIRAILEVEGIKSFLLVPVLDQGRLWGSLGFDERRRERNWAVEDTEALRAAANILSAAIASERIKAELATSESELQAIFSAIRHAVYVVDAEGRYLKVVPTNPELLVRPAEEMLGKTFHDILPPELADRFLICVGQTLSGKGPVQVDYVLPIGDPPRVTWFTSVMTALSETKVLIVAHDISERKKTEAAVRQSEARYRQLFENLLESVYQSTSSGRIVSANPAMVRLLGYDSEEELLSVKAAETYASVEDRKVWVERMSQEGELRNFELTLKRKDGSPISVLLNARAFQAPETGESYYEGTITDITDRKRLESQLILAANRDPLTSLFNRRRFQEELELQLNKSKRFGMQAALLWVDIDRFKEVNDIMGHRAGDELLVELARLLEGLLRGGDVLSRLGGDEFAILMPDVDALQAQVVAGRLLEAVHKHTFEIGDQPLRITVSIGIALYPEHAASADKLLVHADLAMYRAKEEGRNRFSFYKIRENHLERQGFRVTWIKKIRRALDNDQLVLLVQPILDLKADAVSQYELLLRMEGEGGGLVSPATFMDVAVKFNLIQEIDHWVMRQAIRIIQDQTRAGRRLLLEINLSPKAFVDAELLELMENELAAIDPACLIVEITEISTLAEFHHAQRFISTVKKLGCRCALDDFGVGLTSFQHLKHLPLDFLKIDGSLIENLARNAVNQHIVQAICHLTHGLGIKTIAECVDGPETICLLKEYGVDFAQGFGIAEPKSLASVFN